MLDRSRKEEIGRWLNDDDASASALLALIADYFVDSYREEDGDSFLDWLPQTLYEELAEDFGGVDLENFNKIFAATVVYNTDRFFTDLRDWTHLCGALVDGELDLTSVELPEPETFVPAIFEAMLIQPPGAEEEKNPLSPEIVAYIEKSLRQHGCLEIQSIFGPTMGSSNERNELLSKAELKYGPEAAAVMAKLNDEMCEYYREIGLSHMRKVFDQLKKLKLNNGDFNKLLEKAK